MITRRNLLRGKLFQAYTPDADVHLLNRISYGATPESLAELRDIGRTTYLDAQLNPNQIDDSDCDERLRTLPLLQMDWRTTANMRDAEWRSAETLRDAFITRAVHSKRQLFERTVEFWADHFNIALEDNGVDLLELHRSGLRRHAFSRFHHLLLATAKSPAMLVYLDNAFSTAQHPNENYARELLELHTLGVDGGYTEQDVVEVARAFTGWTTHNGTADRFYFSAEDHDTGRKRVLGHALPAGRGIEDGLHVLTILASHPSTARFVGRKLCVRFVSDNPPASLLDSTTAVWQQTRGDIRAVLRHILTSDEFAASAGQKLRRPLDFFVGALRATSTTLRSTWRLEEMLAQLGQPPYQWHPPNGYPDVAGAWLSTGGLMARWQVAQTLTHEAYSVEDYELTTTLRDPIGTPRTAGELVDAVAAQVFGAPLTGTPRQRFLSYIGRADTDPIDAPLIGRKLATLYGLMLSSPYFQWR